MGTTTPHFTGRRILLGAFVVSGFTGLIYESIWSHYLKLFLGHAAYAQTLVLAIFMGGLALGSAIVARYSVRIKSLLWGYVLVEGTTGILGILFHRVFVASSDFSFNTAIPALAAGLPTQFYKWSLASLLILPQSVLLGMTFPLISGALIRCWPERPGETLSILYFTNCLGAAVGVLVSGFVLIGMVGLPGTILTAGLLNVIVALVVWSVVRRQTEPAPVPNGVPTLPARDQLARWFVLAAFLTGAASFMYELGWIRMLSLVLGSSTHSFELMLSAFIFGLAFGGLYVRRRIDGIRYPEKYLGAIMVVMGSLAALTLPAYNLMFDFMAWALGTFTRTHGGYVAFNVASQSIAILIMVPATFCAGMTLPLLTHALMRRGKNEEAIGTIYSVNTLGAIIGVLLTVHLLMPLIGVKGVILTGATIHIALGVSRLIANRSFQLWPAGVAVAASIAVLGFAATFVKLDHSRMASGVFRTGVATLPTGATVTYLRDGKTATVSLVEQEGLVQIATNGKPDAMLQMGRGAASPDEVTMVLAAAIPLSMHPHPGRVANIGFGSGLTAHTLLGSPSVKRLDSIEIEPLMVEAARRGFGSRIHNVFEDSRSHIVFEDAKTFFASSREPYDVIISEPSNPWVSGVASLFSDEFYERITHYLHSDGYFVQWLQVYETDLNVFASVVKALSAHFERYAIYDLDDSNVLIVATRTGAMESLSDRIFPYSEMRTELNRVGVRSVADILLRKIGDNQTLGTLLNALPVPRNSDFFPFVDLNASRLRYLQTNAIELPGLTVLPVPFLELILGNSLPDPTQEPAIQSALARDSHVRKALAIRSAVTSGRLGELDGSDASALLLIEMSAQRCADREGQTLWKLAVRQISDLTAPYLSPSELGEIWNKVRSGPCYLDVPRADRAWADLFVAISQRNAADIVKLGTELLSPDAQRSKDEIIYLTTVTAAAYIRTGRFAEARTLLNDQASHLSAAGQYDLPLQELWVLSRAPRVETIAHASP